MTLDKIEHHLKSWELNPISPLNDWFTLVDEPWTSLLESALSFLSADYPGNYLDKYKKYQAKIKYWNNLKLIIKSKINKVQIFFSIFRFTT